MQPEWHGRLRARWLESRSPSLLWIAYAHSKTPAQQPQQNPSEAGEVAEQLRALVVLEEDQELVILSTRIR